MRPYRPDVLIFTSSDKKNELQIPKPPGKPTLKWSKENYQWPVIENAHPKLVLFNAPEKQLILIGGLGDPGMELGKVYVYSLEGLLIKLIDLEKEIPELKNLSSEWRVLHNFPWLAAFLLDKNGENVFFWICRQIKASINLKDFSAVTEQSQDVKYWKNSTPVHNKAMPDYNKFT